MRAFTRNVGAALLFAAVLGALTMVVVAVPATAAPASPVDVNLDFATFAPGTAQVRSTTLDVPVRSRVAAAGIARATGPAAAIVWAFELCRAAACRPIAVDDEIAAGSYSLRVSAILPTDAPRRDDGDQSDHGDGAFFGHVQLVEFDDGGHSPSRQLLALTAVAVVGAGLAVAGTNRRRRSAR